MATLINTCTYGDFTFPFATVNVTSGLIYAEDTMTRVGRRYVFSISGVLGGVSQTDLANRIVEMQNILRMPRLNLRIHWDGDGSADMFFYTPAGGGSTGKGSDIAWGPLPGDLNITKFSGGRAAFYQWNCTVNTMDTALKSHVLAATWNWTHSIDASGYTSRTVRGKILIDSSVVAAGQGADYYRNVVTEAIPILQYFKRESQEYSQSEDGRVLSFSVTDAETFYTLPNPITSGHASWIVRLHGIGEADALVVDYVLSGWFESSANHGKGEIITAIFNLVAAKFGAVAAAGNGTPVIFGERILREDVYGRNRIDFSISAIQPGGGAATDGTTINFNVGLQTFGIQPPDSNGVALVVNPYGETEGLTSGAYARAPLLYDADPATGVSETGGYQFEDSGSPPLITPTPAGGKGAPPAQSATPPLVQILSDAQKKTPFIAFHEVLSYEYDNHIVLLVPKASDADPIVQQTGVPTLTVIQAGYSKQIAKTASGIAAFGSPPALASPDYAITSAYVSTPNEEPIADGTYKVFSTEWRYVYVKGKQVTSSDTQLLPFDPRLSGSTNTEIKTDQLPDVVETPDS